MAVPAQISKKLRESLGPEAGEILVTWLQEMRAEHDELRASIRADFAEFRHEMAALIQASESRLIDRIHKEVVTLGDRIHAVEARLDERVGRVEVRVAEVKADVAGVKADLMKWSFVFWVSAVGAIAALAGVLRN